MRRSVALGLPSLLHLLTAASPLLAGNGGISGTITTAAASGLPATIVVRVYAAFIEVAQTSPALDGTYDTGLVLAAGSYYVWVGSPEGALLYDGIDCISPCCTPGCNVTAGTPVVVNPDATTTGIDLELPATGTMHISGTCGALKMVGSATIYDDSGQTVSGVQLFQSVGDSNPLPVGSYFLRGYGTNGVEACISMLLGQENCPFEFSCNPTTGTPFVIEEEVTLDIAFALDAGGGFTAQ